MAKQRGTLIEKNRINRGVTNPDEVTGEVVMLEKGTEPPKPQKKSTQPQRSTEENKGLQDDQRSESSASSPAETPTEHLKDVDPASQPADQGEVGAQIDGGGIDPRSQRVLMKVTAMFPFQFFPDELVIDEMKVTYVNRTFFFTSQMRSILINDISDVLVEAIPFFATLRVVANSAKYQEIKIPYLRRDEAIKAQKMIQGLIISRAQALQLNKFTKEQLVQKIESLGTVEEVQQKELQEAKM